MENITSIFKYLGSLSERDFNGLLIWLPAISLLTFVLSLLLLPYMIRKIPSNYFLTLSSTPAKAIDYDIKFLFFFLLRNIFGCFLLLSGVIMLFLPGQGLITIFVSLLLIDFPFKRRLITFLIVQKKIQNSINWIRKKTNKPPINWPPR
ncbi:PGPGW domain-containing protein [Desulforhopalus sp. 52FAK]